MESDLLPGTLEWWHIILSIIAIIFTFGMKWFSSAFRNWADRLDSFQKNVDRRLDHVEKTFLTQSREIAARFDEHRDQVHNLTVRVERRVTWIEATLKNAPYLADEKHPRRRWYEQDVDESGLRPVLKRRTKKDE